MTLSQNLYGPFLKNDVTNIVTHHLLGNDNAAQISYTNIGLRMQKILTMMNLTPVKKSYMSLQDVLAVVIQAQESLQDIDHQSATKMRHNIQVLRSWIELVDDYKFGVYKHVTNLSG